MGGIRDVLYVRYQVPDLALQQQFLEDFGFLVMQDNGRLLARGTDPSRYVYVAEQADPAFVAVGFEAESEADLTRIAAIDGVAIESLDLPGGGKVARLTDPNGFTVEIVWGIDNPGAGSPPSRSAFNSGEERHRYGERVTFDASPHTVKRLGHCVLNVNNFRESEAWYKERIGIITSDEVFIGEEDNVLGAFFRLNRGDEYVDHHTLFLVGTGKPGINHAAFEVADWDSLMSGHHDLLKKGYKHSWGVGKHLLGSQVFDYWKDTAGFTLEHFTDGDLFNASFGSHKAAIDKLLGVRWGPEGSP